jgi:hypothetical protein
MMAPRELAMMLEIGLQATAGLSIPLWAKPHTAKIKKQQNSKQENEAQLEVIEIKLINTIVDYRAKV